MQALSVVELHCSHHCPTCSTRRESSKLTENKHRIVNFNHRRLLRSVHMFLLIIELSIFVQLLAPLPHVLHPPRVQQTDDRDRHTPTTVNIASTSTTADCSAPNRETHAPRLVCQGPRYGRYR
jgi:predicted nucleic acid-binding Zn ribbon protein